jgi:xylulokinase
MAHLLGIDLGTSSVKAVIIDARARILGVGAAEYPILVPQSGYAEQAPQQWLTASTKAVLQACAEANTRDIGAIGLSGQMHGTVLLNQFGEAVAPAIIWADQRSAAVLEEFTTTVGRERLVTQAGTAPAAGFMGATLLWLKRYMPKLLEDAEYAVLPKDYVRRWLTDEVDTEVTDSSSTGLFDIQERRWSTEIIQALELPLSLFPLAIDPAAVGGVFSSTAAKALNLKAGIPVVAGCADQTAQAVGNGLIDPGTGSITIGTGGQVFVPQSAPTTDPQLRLHTFCHAPSNRWYTLGAMLAAGLSLRWLRNTLGMEFDADAYEKLANLAAKVTAGADGLLFLPYLIGERAPLNDPHARGSFTGLQLGHGVGHLGRAIMEGVAFALRHILDVMAESDMTANEFLVAGGGLASPVWRHIVADVIGLPLKSGTGRERAGLGAALIAGIGTGIYGSYTDTLLATAADYTITEPDPIRHQRYQEQYQRFLRAYPQIKAIG